MTDYETPVGPARVLLTKSRQPRAMLVLGHGAAGDVDAPDIAAVAEAVHAAKVSVALVTQPYRVAGRRTPPPSAQLDAAWTAVVRALKPRVPLVLGGRSSGARVACRTAAALGAAGVVALAFPLHPPGRPERSRAEELRTGVPTLVVNGDRDPFGVPEPGGDVELCVRPGDRHDLRRDLPGTAALVVDWLRRNGWAA